MTESIALLAPTDAVPGSEEKIDLLTARRAAGLPLHVFGDRYHPSRQRVGDHRVRREPMNPETAARLERLARMVWYFAHPVGMSVRQVSDRTRVKKSEIADVIEAIKRLGLPRPRQS
jgi:hypothetical protein